MSSMSRCFHPWSTWSNINEAANQRQQYQSMFFILQVEWLLLVSHRWTEKGVEICQTLYASLCYIAPMWTRQANQKDHRYSREHSKAFYPSTVNLRRSLFFFFLLPRCASCCSSVGRASCGCRSGTRPRPSATKRRWWGSWCRSYSPASLKCAAFWSGGTSRLSTRGRVLAHWNLARAFYRTQQMNGKRRQCCVQVR